MILWALAENEGEGEFETLRSISELSIAIPCASFIDPPFLTSSVL
jgi:hypothetical protein